VVDLYSASIRKVSKALRYSTQLQALVENVFVFNAVYQCNKRVRCVTPMHSTNLHFTYLLTYIIDPCLIVIPCIQSVADRVVLCKYLSVCVC